MARLKRPEWTESRGKVLIASAIVGQAILMAAAGDMLNRREPILLAIMAISTVEYFLGSLLIFRDEEDEIALGCFSLMAIGLLWLILWMLVLTT